VSNCFYNSLCSATLMKQAQHHHLKLFLLQIPQPNCHVPPKRAKCLRDLKRHIQLWVLCIHVHSSVPIGDHGTPHSCGKTCAAEPLDDHEADLLGGAVGPALECVFFCHLSSPAGHMPRRSAILEGRQHRDSALHHDFELVLLKVEVRR
jgi:hypothetical protein